MARLLPEGEEQRMPQQVRLSGYTSNVAYELTVLTAQR